MTRHLVLVGLMGAGKTTVGMRCATRLGWSFVDTDDVVERVAGLRVAEVFADQGEAAFRELERAAVADACAAPEPLVIACGGGAILDAGSRRLLREHGCVVWLTAPPGELAARVGAHAARRPLLGKDGAEATLARLETQRCDAYEAVAHATVDTAGKGVEAVVDAVLEELARCDG